MVRDCALVIAGGVLLASTSAFANVHTSSTATCTGGVFSFINQACFLLATLCNLHCVVVVVVCGGDFM